MSGNKADILILTAGFGDGHNSAARNLSLALEPHCPVLCCDPCAEGAPFINERLRSFYRGVTTHAPWLWRRIYLSTERQDFSKERLPMMRKPENRLHELIKEHQPKAIVSTYPLYPYFLERIFQTDTPKVPVITVVTDSIEINAAWRKAPTDYWLVTDRQTRESLIRQGLPETKLIETGFPVNPHFADLEPIRADDSLTPFRVLYFPTAKKPFVRRASREILDAGPENIELTIVLGRNLRKLYSRAKEIKDSYPGRVRILGWTKRVPELLTSHHLVVGKAGGATVHESLAAACPMLIHHLVPGQEEGNLNLLRHLNGGHLADTPGALSAHLREMLSDHATGWRSMKRNLARHARPGAAHTAANFILKQCGEQT
ncbi:MGDG synthase family glycosyltransferase [Oceaniferula spumae]|uniref:MGDG synthase family glycosyltransferase n=1 Tax=Oceaniferula spumae TaxID=2979115 RepID=UPI003F4E60A0